MCSCPTLAYADMDKEFILSVDGSKSGLGYVLSQLDSLGHEHPISFGSRGLSKCERQYSVSEFECLALLTGVRQFHSFLANRKFKVLTDHMSLKYLNSLKVNEENYFVGVSFYRLITLKCVTNLAEIMPTQTSCPDSSTPNHQKTTSTMTCMTKFSL